MMLMYPSVNLIPYCIILVTEAKKIMPCLTVFVVHKLGGEV